MNETGTLLVGTLYRLRAGILDQLIEHHCCSEKILIRCPAALELLMGLKKRGWRQPSGDPYTGTVLAVGTPDMYRDLPCRALDGDPVFWSSNKWKRLHNGRIGSYSSSLYRFFEGFQAKSEIFYIVPFPIYYTRIGQAARLTVSI